MKCCYESLYLLTFFDLSPINFPSTQPLSQSTPVKAFPTNGASSPFR